MGTSNDFKEKLKAGKLADALTLALGEAIELEITTWVSSAHSETEAPIDEPQAGYRMRTRMNIVDGDIDNEVGSRFVSDGPYRELQQFHLDQVREGRYIIQQNLESLQQLFTVFTQTIAQLPQGSRRSGSRNSLLPSAPDNQL